MRDIKFRAWNGRRMLFNGLGGFCDFEIHGGAIFEYSSTGYDIIEKDYPLMQFTGLQDCNGVDIYEGDIVRQERKDNCFGGHNRVENEVIGQPEYIELSDYESGGPEGNWPIVKMEVIGNIHQHPELLRGDS